ncbi:UbiA family prenyltransferase [Kitasatospora sp. MAP5-34]|uniref:UbiA family prenyltransferase n=1 Tax=Kitasatospora sp. MAP5-34 TaxID=3035102 RepID=UPI002476728C|nr:UbiA family prenyltransferase [Kitasatospora sp. MAP5-34]MDH6577437.1 4-hydroxybenzoate polyprenyltransferase [Kitasatospora sp. MAP5-34]
MVTTRHFVRHPAARGLLSAAHLAPSVAVTAVATALAAGSGGGAAGSALVALAVLTGQLSVGWCNDRADLRRDLATGRRDKPLVAGVLRPRTVAVAAGCALALCVPLSLANGAAAGGAHLTGVAAAWAYNLGVKRTVLSWLPYVVAFGLLPAFLTLALPGHPWPPAWAVAASALLGVGAHAANVLPDIADDLRTGVHGLPQRLGVRRARLLAAVPLFAASAVLALGPPGRLGTAGRAGLVVTGALALALALPLRAGARSRLPFLAALGLAVLDVALLLLRGSALA